MSDSASREWHLDKRVPLALIFMLLMQFAGLVWWGSQISARLDVLERAVLSRTDDHERLVRIETAVAGIDRRLERMEDAR